MKHPALRSTIVLAAASLLAACGPEGSAGSGGGVGGEGEGG